MRKLLLLIILLPFALFAQNIIPNGGFEQYTNNRPLNWTFSRFLNYERTVDSHTGSYAAMFYANGGSINLVSANFQDYNILDVRSNSEYTFSYWYKGTGSRRNITVSITWYKDNERIKRDYYDGEEVFLSQQWNKKELTVTAPVGVNKAGVSFSITEDNGAQIFIDDIEMVFKQKLVDVVPVPSGINAVPFQREIELNWSREADSDIEWEVVVDDNAPQIATKNSFTIEDLELGKTYKVKLRAKNGNTYSDYSEEMNITTRNLEYSVESLERIPRLRTLGIDGDPTKTIKLYFTDLAKKDAEINYYVDGVKINPNGNTLTFPKLGRQKLTLEIKESEDLQWEIDYNVNVRQE